MSNRAAYISTITACLGLLLFPAAAAHADEPVIPTPSCTIVGTAGDDVLQGTAEDDVICGLGGDDTLVGMGGDDVLRGGEGDDLLVGGTGNDQLYGDAGADRLLDIQDRTTGDGGAGTDLCVAITGSVTSNCETRYLLPGSSAGTR